MFEKLVIFVVLVVISMSVIDMVNGQGDIYTKNQDELQKIVKRNRQQSGNDDFEKFFLKASKSVPRIGRRRIEEHPSVGKLPLWAELSDLYEYNPELFASPQLLVRWLEYYNSQLPREDAKLFDDGLDAGWSTKMRFKRENQSPESYEYRYQP